MFSAEIIRDREIAEELTQQTFAIAFENWKISEVNVNYRCGYVRLRSMNIMRGQKKQKRYANKLDENHADQGEDLLNGIINQENGQIIQKNST